MTRKKAKYSAAKGDATAGRCICGGVPALSRISGQPVYSLTGIHSWPDMPPKKTSGKFRYDGTRQDSDDWPQVTRRFLSGGDGSNRNGLVQRISPV